MSPKFLIVDDEPQTLDLIKVILESYGCQADTCDGGEKALEILGVPERAAEYDAVFLDVVMPALSGYAVLERIKEMQHTASLPVMLITAQGGTTQIAQGYVEGADYYIPKPFTKEQLAYALDLFLGEQSQDNGTEEKPVPVHPIDYNPDTDPDPSSGLMVLSRGDIKTK